MRKLSFFLLFASVVASIFTSCQKIEEGISILPYTPKVNYKGTADFFAKHQPKSQFFTINGTTGGVVTGERGTVINFPANGFAYYPSLQIVKGDVIIELRELYNPSDMIFANKPTVSNGRPLMSGGELYIRAISVNDGIEVKLAPGIYYQAIMPTSIANMSMSMDVFFGEDTTVEAPVNWEVNPDTPAIVQPWTQTGGGMGAFAMYNDSLHWGNCDQFMYLLGYNDFTTINVNSPNNPILDSCVCFVNFKGYKTVWNLNRPWGNTGNTAHFTSDHVCDVPANIVVMGVKNQQLYFGMLENVSLTNNATFSVPVTTKSEEEVKTLMQKLD